ncbi:uncharacterized protein NESG_00615 [Nematocida ausubeli]|uniref:Uncharacterized protein n=1 Tax=Nematocida ausubeli (strain ATCC PRA-371 / ERTm2) TaxID=1913371 RepID=A0A086J2V1_NEMA1|nr:uncharacterized protein NESG_00615 [Nematocida ausubeli]KFG26469.1 hypothetical protein NESG_00615 [Nematocida ausubeli]
MQIDQRDEQRRSFISERLIRFKRYIRGRKLLKYLFFALGTFLSVAMIVIYYIYYMMGSSAGDGQDAENERPPIEMAEEKGTDINMHMASSDGTDALVPYVEGQPLNTFHSYAAQTPSIVVTEITEETAVGDLERIYPERIYTAGKTCNDNLCGRCTDCAFYEDRELYTKMKNAVKLYKTTTLYDTTEKLTEFVDGINKMHSNFDEKYMQFLAKEISNDRIVWITLRLTAPSNYMSNKAPLVCSIFAEGIEYCSVHRFRLQVVSKNPGSGYMELLEPYFKYKGYSLRSSLKNLCKQVLALKSGETAEVSFSMVLPNHISLSKVSAAEQSESICSAHEKNMQLLERAVCSDYTIESIDKSGKTTVESIQKYKLAHFVSLFGYKKKSVKKDNILIAFSATPNRTLEGIFDDAMKYLRRLVKVSKVEKNKIEEGKYYGSEEVYGISLLSSICGWTYKKGPVSIKIAARDGMIEKVSACGMTIHSPCTVEEALQLTPIFDQVVALSNTGSAEFVQTARDTLEILEYKKPGCRAEIEMDLNKNTLFGYIRVYNPLGDLESSKMYEFALLDALCKALEDDTKEPWLSTFMQSLAFAACIKKPENSSAMNEVITVGEFLGAPEPLSKKVHTRKSAEDTWDALDVLYSYLADKKTGPVNYVCLLVGESIFLKLSIVKEIDGEKVIYTTLYSYKKKNLVEKIRDALKSNVSFGIFNKKDLVAWSGINVAYNVYKSKIENIALNIVDYAYYRIYFSARPILNAIKRDNLAEIKPNTDSPKMEEEFFAWLAGFTRFSTVSIDHPILPMIMECGSGHSLSFTVELTEKKIKSKASETSCKVNIRSGTFEETVELDYAELGTSSGTVSDNEKALRLLFARVLNLPTVKEDPEAFLHIHIETLPHYPTMYIHVREHGEGSQAVYNPKEKIEIDLAELKKNAKTFISEAGDAFLVENPQLITNGNMAILLAIA